MKKLFTLAVFALASLNIMATDYKDNLQIEINGKVVSNDQSTISVDQQEDGKYTLSLKNFQFKMGIMPMKVGNIIITDVPGVSNGVNTMIKTSQEITITAGDSGKGWVGPGLGKVPVNMVGEIRENTFYTIININMASMNQQIKVTFGKDGYQIPNSDFEQFHTASVSMVEGSEPSTSDEPNNWHSFMSASGNPVLVYLAGYAPHTFISDEVRPGSTGKKSVKLLALDMGIAIANGTITTGRMNTGSTTAAETDSNYAWMDTSKTDVDANGDPFYATLVSKPDSIKFWTRFNQGTHNAEHPYATCSAIITDGTRFQEPAPTNVTYTNIVGEARNPQITETGKEWKEISIPFEYNNNGLSPKAILVTISTNADAGQGSDRDSLYVDDLSLVYNAGLKSVKFKGENVDIIEKIKSGTVMNAGSYNLNDFVVEANGAGAYVTKEIVDVYDPDFEVTTYELHITVTSGDLQTENQYVVYINGGTPTGIKSITLPNGVQAIYNISGQKVSNMVPGQVYIMKTTDGKTKKFIKK